MTENTQNVEKENVKAGAVESAAQTSRESLSNEALNERIKSSSSPADKEGLSSAAAAAMAGAEKAIRNGNLPNVIVDRGGCVPQVGDNGITSKEIKDRLSEILKPKEGIVKLPTGDFLVRDEDKQTLFTPNGDRITIKDDGTSTIKGDVKKVSTGKDGNTTVEFADGAKVTFNKYGFEDITRGNKSHSFLTPRETEKPWRPRTTEPLPDPRLDLDPRVNPKHFIIPDLYPPEHTIQKPGK